MGKEEIYIRSHYRLRIPFDKNMVLALPRLDILIDFNRSAIVMTCKNLNKLSSVYHFGNKLGSPKYRTNTHLHN